MRELLADSAGLAQLIDPSEPLHSQAKAVAKSERGAGCRFVLSNYVLTELVSLLHSPLRMPRPQIVAVVNALLESPSVVYLHVDRATHDRAWELLQHRLDKAWSLVDCVSFVIMADRGMTDAFTTDHHFEQAGFTRML